MIWESTFMVECKSFESGQEGSFPLMLNLWQDCAMCSKASRSATVRTKITSINIVLDLP